MIGAIVRVGAIKTYGLWGIIAYTSLGGRRNFLLSPQADFCPMVRSGQENGIALLRQRFLCDGTVFVPADDRGMNVGAVRYAVWS
jgi:hypothetical protein